jgi:hypothetical protein
VPNFKLQWCFETSNASTPEGGSSQTTSASTLFRDKFQEPFGPLLADALTGVIGQDVAQVHQQRQCKFLTQALPPAGQRSSAERHSVDKEFLLQDVLRTGLSFHRGLAGKI